MAVHSNSAAAQPPRRDARRSIRDLASPVMCDKRPKMATRNTTTPMRMSSAVNATARTATYAGSSASVHMDSGAGDRVMTENTRYAACPVMASLSGAGVAVTTENVTCPLVGCPSAAAVRQAIV